MKRFALFLVVSLLAACTETPTQTVAPDAALAPSVSMNAISNTVAGSGAFEFAGGLRTFSFNAQVNPDGSARGQFQLYTRGADVRVKGVVTCATVFGSVGWFGGIVTSAGVRQGREVNFIALDGGEGRKGFGDGISLLLVGGEGAEVAQPFCDNTPFNREIFPTQGITITAPGSSSFTSSVTFPINIAVFIPCALEGAGEIAVLEGSLHSLFHFTEDQAGGFLFRSNNNPQGVSGYGLTSGDKYQGTGMGGGTDHFTLSGLPANFTFVDNFRIIGQGDGNNLLVHGNFHLTVNANGEVTAIADNFSVSCR